MYSTRHSRWSGFHGRAGTLIATGDGSVPVNGARLSTALESVRGSRVAHHAVCWTCTVSATARCVLVEARTFAVASVAIGSDEPGSSSASSLSRSSHSGGMLPFEIERSRKSSALTTRSNDFSR